MGMDLQVVVSVAVLCLLSLCFVLAFTTESWLGGFYCEFPGGVAC